MSKDNERLKELAVIQSLCRDDLLFFTRYFFKARFGRKWVLNWHHEVICEALNRVYKGQCKRLIINISPRYSKTEIAVINFIACGIAINPKANFIHLSYSETLTLKNSKDIKNLLELREFKEVFGDIEIRPDSRSSQLWNIKQGGGLYATSTGGHVTGFGAGLVDNPEGKYEFGGAIVIDDAIKPEDADSDTLRENVNSNFDSTIVNRVNSRETPIIVIGQRTHPNDLPGYLIKHSSEEWEVVSIPCLIEKDGIEEALWSFKHTLKELYDIRKNNIIVFDRQYMQNPKPLAGLMYPKEWMVYEELPTGEVVRSQTDIADDGICYLCSIKFTEQNNLRYVMDIVYTQEPTEVTESLCVELNKDVNYANFESNNGGKAFARKVESMSRDKGNYKTTFSWYHEHDNKDARIRTNASTVQNIIVFPRDWAIRWPKFYDHVTNYMLTGKNKYKDAPDVLTAMCEREPYGDQWASVN